MKRILYIIYTLDAGGIESLGMNIFRSINRDEYKFDFLVVKDKDQVQLYDNEVKSLGGSILPVGKCKSNKIIKYISTEVDIAKIIKTGNYDAVHINSGHVHTFPEAFFAKHYGVKRILVHSHNGELVSTAKFYRLRYILQRWYRNNISKYATSLLTCSDLAAQWSFPSNGEIIQINNGIDLKKYAFNSNRRKEIRDSLGLTDEFVIGHIGRMNKQKNHRFLIEIFYEVQKINRNSRLILCGTGELKEELQDYVVNLGIGHKVVFYGVTKDIPSILSAIDVFVFPSLFEGLPVVGIEAQANGVPILASDTITKDVAITPCWNYMSLNDNAQKWAENALRIKRDFYIDNSELLKKSGFDITHSIEVLEKLYD